MTDIDVRSAATPTDAAAGAVEPTRVARGTGAGVKLAAAPSPDRPAHPGRPADPARRLARGVRAGAVAVARRPAVALAVLWLAAVLLAAVAPGVLTSTDPLAGVPADKLSSPTRAHWFGTDQLGRDLYTRVVHGTGLTLRGAVVAVTLGLVVGALIGLVAGSAGRRVDDVIMRGVDVLLAIPSLLLSLSIITALGVGTVNVAIAVGLASVASVARVMRSEVLRVRGSDYVEAARAYGGRPAGVLLRHVLPNASGPVVALAALELGTAILAISSLSFLGFGEPPPAPEWGALVAGGRDYLRTAWWLTTLPGATIALSVLAANHLSRTLDSHLGGHR